MEPFSTMFVPDRETDPFSDLKLAAFLADEEFQALRRRRRWQAIAFVILLMVAITLISL